MMTVVLGEVLWVSLEPSKLDCLGCLHEVQLMEKMLMQRLVLKRLRRKFLLSAKLVLAVEGSHRACLMCRDF